MWDLKDDVLFGQYPFLEIYRNGIRDIFNPNCIEHSPGEVSPRSTYDPMYLYEKRNKKEKKKESKNNYGWLISLFTELDSLIMEEYMQTVELLIKVSRYWWMVDSLMEPQSQALDP